MRWHWVAGVIVVALVSCRPSLIDYFHEMTETFNGPMEGIVASLDSKAAVGDVVGITYGDTPLKFYTRLRVVGGLTGEDLSEARMADWIIIRQYAGDVLKERPVRDFLEKQLARGNYEQIVLSSPDTAWENREDPAVHLFRSVTQEQPVVIWRRISENLPTQR